MSITRAERTEVQLSQPLKQQLGNLPETLIVGTPNNGRHYLFEFPQQFRDAPIKRELASGVELKVNGYVVAPPSKLKKVKYSVRNRATLASLPQGWKAACIKDEPTPRSGIAWSSVRRSTRFAKNLA